MVCTSSLLSLGSRTGHGADIVLGVKEPFIITEVEVIAVSISGHYAFHSNLLR